MTLVYGKCMKVASESGIKTTQFNSSESPLGQGQKALISEKFKQFPIITHVVYTITCGLYIFSLKILPAR